MIHMFALLRIIIGSIFLVSSFGKLFSPYQNFLYAVQAYELLPSQGEILVAQILPWIEVIVGAFVVLGLWTSLSLKGAAVLFGVFVTVVGQALLRGLPLENCGCFGGLIHFKPQMVIVMDSACLIITLVLLRNLLKTRKFGLDYLFQ